MCSQSSRLLGKAHCGSDQEHARNKNSTCMLYTRHYIVCYSVCVCVCVPPSLQRAPSVPIPQVPDRPPRSNTVDAGSFPNSAYAPLSISTREQAGVYQELAPSPSGGRRRPVQKQNSSRGRSEQDGSGVYQALVEPNREAPSTYAVCPGISCVDVGVIVLFLCRP